MTIIQSLILGLIEGLTEFLPSPQQLTILGAKALRLPDDNFLNTFIISIQEGYFSRANFILAPSDW